MKSRKALDGPKLVRAPLEAACTRVAVPEAGLTKLRGALKLALVNCSAGERRFIVERDRALEPARRPAGRSTSSRSLSALANVH